MRLAFLLALAACASSKEPVPVGPEVGTDSDTPTATDAEAYVPSPDTDTAVVDSDTAWMDTALPGTLDLEILLTADDAWVMWIDGVATPAPNQTGWSRYDQVLATLPAGQRHVIAIQASDQARVISGFIAVVRASLEVYSVTGDGKWKMLGEAPNGDWTAVDYDDSAWGPAVLCTPDEVAVWGTYWPADFYTYGATWIWSRTCRSLGTAWFRLVIE